MTARHFAEWRAYESLEPFGPPAEFWRAALVAAVMANANRTKKQKAFQPEDFMPRSLFPEPTEPDPDEVAASIRERFASFAALQRNGGRDRGE
jgi:hypothetical protein